MARWTKLAGEGACGSDYCPAVHLSGDGRLYVQGRRASNNVRTELGLGPDEDAVELPRRLLAQALASLVEHRGGP